MTDKVMVALDRDELAFIKALNDGDEAAMIAIFVGLNGTKTLDFDEPQPGQGVDISTPPAEKSADAEKPAREWDIPPEIVLRFIKAWKADDIDGLQSLVDEKRGAPLPASHVAREKTRARAIAPDIRLDILYILEDFRDTIFDQAFRIMKARPHYGQVGIFENDIVATEMLHGIIDYLSLYPHISQLADEYHVYPYFDIDWSAIDKTLTARDPAGKVQLVEDLSGDGSGD